MRLLGLEIKRVLKSRLTWILLLAAVLCSFLFAYVPTTFIYYTDDAANTTVKGLPAIRRYKEIRKDISGEVTPAILEHALSSLQETLKNNGTAEIYELPETVYNQEYLPYSPLMSGIREAYADPNTGMAATLTEIAPEELQTFYEACDARLISLMKMEQPGAVSAQKQAVERYEKVNKPYVYYSGITSDAMDYEALLLFLILICCSMVTAPVFTSDYQTGADSILRCTKYGRTSLAVVKIVSACIISIVTFVICVLAWILMTNSLFGWESTKTSVQLVFSITSLVAWNIGQLQWAAAAAGLLSLLATISFVLFLSSKCKTTVISSALSVFLCVLPLFLSGMLPDALAVWFRGIWPTGAIGLQNNILYDFIGYEFLNVGSISVWLPYAIIGFAVIEIPLFIGLTIRAYNKHVVN